MLLQWDEVVATFNRVRIIHYLMRLCRKPQLITDMDANLVYIEFLTWAT
jgi:hypothetical protein